MTEQRTKEPQRKPVPQSLRLVTLERRLAKAVREIQRLKARLGSLESERERRMEDYW